MNVLSPLVHPFPARMAPQLALDRLPRRGDRPLNVLDPMMGSGTIPVLAAMRRHEAAGFDLDPLAVLIARTWGHSLPAGTFMEAAREVARSGREEQDQAWHHDDAETQQFIDYWFDRRTQLRLAALARAISAQPARLRTPLWCAFSRLIITKDAGASRARDVSHSRPHRVREYASFDPIDRFVYAAEVVSKRHRLLSKRRPAQRRLRLERADSRALPLPDESVDVAMTSPPYLQAIDYLRGHRLSLVWMGYKVAELRDLRGTTIGSERKLASAEGWCQEICAEATATPLPSRSGGILHRYISDLDQVVGELVRVLRPGGKATFVVADATLSGVSVSVSRIVERVAARHELRCVHRLIRDLAGSKRYLPPPTDGTGTLDKRMRRESCMTFERG